MADYAQDADLLADLEKAKLALHTFYRDKYANFTSELGSDKRGPLTTAPVVQNGSPQKVDFTARYKRTNRRVSDELEDYFKLGQEDFETCRPLDWWWGRRAQFPNLYRLARDVLAIPGESFSLLSCCTCDLRHQSYQVLQLQSSAFSLVAVTLSPCVVQVYTRTLSAP
jgi:hypothetical protein